MGRAPDRAQARPHSITSRMDDTEVAALDANRRARGGMDRSTYIRWLIAQDQRRIANEQAVAKGMRVPAFPAGQAYEPFKGASDD